MQFSVLLLLLVVGITARADQSECAQGYEKAAQRYQSEMERLESLETGAEGGTYVGLAAGAGCAILTRTPAGVVVCAVVGSAVSGSAYAAKAGFEGTIQRLTDAERIFKAYSGEGQDLMQDLGVDIQREDEVTADLTDMIKDGTLCAGGRFPVLSYEEVVEALQQRLASR